MFIHNFFYTSKILFRNKMLLFWTFAFPILLGTFFHMAFSNIENSEKLQVFPIAIVEDEEFLSSKGYQETFQTLGDEESKEQIFQIQYVTEEKAKELLEQDEIIGYMKLEANTPKVVVKTSGINETILKQVTEEIVQTNEMIQVMVEEKIKKSLETGNTKIDYEAIYQEVLEEVNKEKVAVQDGSSDRLSYTMIEFYTLIAMTCLYGGILGMTAIHQNLANMSEEGKRVSVSKAKKGILVMSSLLASYVTQLIGLALLFLYTIFILKVDYGTNLSLVILLGVVGSLAGLSIGLAVGTVLKVKEGIKTGILLAITMLGCFLSGMMGITMKYVIDKNIPIVNQLNPANRITDGFYSLYYYDTLDRYTSNLVSLLLFAFVMVAISYFSLRRQTYDSI